MFSWDYARHAAALAIRNPNTLPSLLMGKDPGAVLYNKRMNEWLRTRQEYLHEPKQTLGFKIFLNPEDMSQISASIATTGWFYLPITCLLLGMLKPGMKSIQPSNFHNVEPVQMILSDKPGTGKLYLAPPSEPNAHTLTQDRGRGSVDVASTSLDETSGRQTERVD